MSHMRLVCACRVAPRVPWHMPQQIEMVLLLAVLHEWIAWIGRAQAIKRLQWL
jgi:hypothetical protein